MTITFFGHSDFCENSKYQKTIAEILERECKGEKALFLLGNYGEFDKFAYSCCKEYKIAHKDSSLIFVTPYISEGYKNTLEYANEIYDSIIYPEIENRPKRFAIYYRNRYMVERADLIIFYVKHNFGGAYKALQYAKKLNKNHIIISNTKID